MMHIQSRRARSFALSVSPVSCWGDVKCLRQIMCHVQVEKGAQVAAGAVVTAGTTVPAGEVWGGNPAKKLRALKPEEASFISKSAAHYTQLGSEHLKATQ